MPVSGVQGRRPIFVAAAWIAATCGLAAGGGVSSPGPDPDTLRQQIAELESKLAEAKAQLAAAEESKGQPAATSEPTPVEALADVPLPSGPPAPKHDLASGDPGMIPGEQPAWATWLRSWKSRVELGLNGNAGNTSRQSIRFVFNSDRKTERLEQHFASNYKLANDDHGRSENRLVIDARNDWLASNQSPIRYFVKGSLELDEFQSWDARASGFGGMGYDIIKGDKTTLVGRGGFGGSQLIGSEDEEFRPEGFVAANLTHQLSDVQKVHAAVEYLPQTDELREFRLNANASWEMRIDPQKDLYLRVGVATRYDSDPGQAETTDLDYFLTLGWTF